MKALVIVVAMALVSALPAGAADEHRLSLNEAIGRALAKSDALLSEREALTAATAGVRQARGAYDPRLGMDYGWSKSRPSLAGLSSPLAPETEAGEAGVAIRQLLPTGGAVSVGLRGARIASDPLYGGLSPAYDTRFGVELRQPLLRHRGMDAARLAVRVARAGEQAADASLRRVRTETVAAVEQAYWGLTAARQAVQVREDAVRLAEEQLGETRTRVEAGTAPETELAQPRAELERRRGELLAARETAARQENTLKLQILGDDDEALWAAQIAPAESAATAITAVDVAASMQRALSARPELDQAQAGITARRARTSFARSGVWPALDAFAAYDRFGLAGRTGGSGSLPQGLEGGLGDAFDALGDGDLHAARVGVTLGFPIANREARGAVVAARAAEQQARVDLSRARKAIRAEVLDAAAALETAGQRIAAAQAGREAAEVQLSAERDRFASGLSTNFLVLTRQNDLARARLDEIAALTDYRNARTEMARATGTLIEERGIPVDQAGRKGGSR